FQMSCDFGRIGEMNRHLRGAEGNHQQQAEQENGWCSQAAQVTAHAPIVREGGGGIWRKRVRVESAHKRKLNHLVSSRWHRFTLFSTVSTPNGTETARSARPLGALVS